MEKEFQKQFMDMGFGFPLLLLNVPMVKVRNVWTPNINYNELAQIVVRTLASKPTRLTGSELKFVRAYFEMTLVNFAKRFCVTHVAVMKWEKSKNRPTSMNWTTEKDIRLFILARLSAKAQDLAALYNNLEVLPEGKPEPIHLDAKTLAA